MFTAFIAAVTVSVSAHAPLVPRPCPRTSTSAAWPQVGRAALCPEWPEAAETAVVVRIYDRPDDLPSSVQGDAQIAATAILRHAGMDVHWLSCDPVRNAGQGATPCGTPLGPRELVVRLGRSTPRNDPATLGFAFVPGVVATALTDRVYDTAVRTGVRFAALLGAVLAHEITHLLTGPEHLHTGLMQPVWTDDEIRKHSALFTVTAADRAAIEAFIAGSARTGSSRRTSVTIADALRSGTAGPGQKPEKDIRIVHGGRRHRPRRAPR